MWRLLLLISSSIRPSSNDLPPSPRRPLCLEEEVANDEEGDEDNDNDDNDIDTATANDSNEDMPPKAKPTAAKGVANSTKPPAAAAAADTVMPPPAAKTKPLKPYSIYVRDAAVVKR